jgi:hypothetical protein
MHFSLVDVEQIRISSRESRGAQQTSIAVRRRKTCVATRARTLGRKLSNDMRESMAELCSLSARIFVDARLQGKNPARISGTSVSHSFQQFIRLKVFLRQALDTPGMALDHSRH